MIKAVLLDVDGTLIDSNDAHAEAFVKAAELHGRKISLKQVRSRIGKGGDVLLSEVLGVPKEAGIIKEISEEKKKIFRTHYLPALKVFPGVRELLQKLHADNFKLIIATSASEEELEGLLEKVGVNDLIDGRTSADDVDRAKPAPDVIHAALKLEGLKPDQAFMLGDTPYDVTAAQHAGVRTIALMSGGWPQNELKEAAEVFKDPADLLENYEKSLFSSPLK